MIAVPSFKFLTTEPVQAKFKNAKYEKGTWSVPFMKCVVKKSNVATETLLTFSIPPDAPAGTKEPLYLDIAYDPNPKWKIQAVWVPGTPSDAYKSRVLQHLSEQHAKAKPPPAKDTATTAQETTPGDTDQQSTVATAIQETESILRRYVEEGENKASSILHKVGLSISSSKVYDMFLGHQETL